MAFKQKVTMLHLAFAIVGQASLGLAPFVLRICFVSAINSFQKQKTERFCNFFAIADSLLFLQSGNKPLRSRFRCIFGPQFVIGGSGAIPNRKKVAILVDFLFLVLGRLRGGAEVG